jgi:peptide/nickel transport system substrate-binding protein
MQGKISRRGFLAGTAAAGALPGVVPTFAWGQDKAQDTLRAVVYADLKILDPRVSNSWITVRHCYLICDTLFGMDSQLRPQPQMVETYTVDDAGLNYSFTLRQGLLFHDGAPVLASDAAASLQRWMNGNNNGKQLGQFVDSVKVVDDRTFTMALNQPYGLVLEALSRPSDPPFVFPERIISAVKEGEQMTETIGSGPFVFDRDAWKPGNEVVYHRNPAYVPRSEPADFMSGGKVANLETVIWRTMPDANTAFSALQAGEVDYYEVPPLDFVALAEQSPDLQVQLIDSIGLHAFIRPNFLQPPFSDVRARQALAHLIDQNNFMRAAVGNPKLFSECHAYFMCGGPNETDIGADPYKTPDVEKAKALMKEAGYNGEKLVLMTPTNAELPVVYALAQYLEQVMKQAGMEVELVVMDWATFVTRRANKGPVAAGGWNLFVSIEGGPDPAIPVTNYWFNSRCGVSAQGWPCDEKLEELLNAYSLERDPDKRHALVEQIQTRAYEYLPQILLGQYLQPVITRKNVEGVLAASQAVYWNIRKT